MHKLVHNEGMEQTLPAFELRHRLRLALEHAHLDPAGMAVELGVHRNTVHNYLSGRTLPDKPALVLWASVCQVPYDWLVNDPKPARGTLAGRPAAGRDPVTDNKNYVEHRKSRARKGTETDSYRQYGRRLLSERNRGCHLDRHARRLLNHSPWVASAERSEGK